MSRTAIEVCGLSKVYAASHGKAYRTLRETLAGVARYRRDRGSRAAPRWALRDVSFAVPQGEVVGIIGRNGAGKSTLLKILSRVTPPTAGRAALRGRVASLLEVGTGFHPELTGRENVYLNGVLLGLSRREVEQRLDGVVEFSGLAQHLDVPLKRYSSGMQLRLAFAVAAELQPEILLLDEVLAVGDVEFQQKCVGRMEGITREGRTVLIVSHSLGAIRSLCQRALLLDGGQLVADGAPDEAIGAYLGRAQSDPAAKALSDADVLHGSGAAYPRRVRLRNGVGDRFSVYWRQPLELELELEVSESLQEVSLGAGVRLPDSTWVFCLHHDDGGAPRWSFAPGHYIVRCRLEHDLKPGTYRLALGAHVRHYGNTLFHCEPVLLTVLDASADGDQPPVYNPGIVNGRAAWDAPVRRAESGASVA